MPDMSAVLKVSLLGETGVGKSAIVTRFVRNVFGTDQNVTIGVDYNSYDLMVDNKNVKFQIYDTAGQERFHSLATMFYRNTNIDIIVYDISNYESFVRAKLWYDELIREKEKVSGVLCGNKSDLEDERAVSVAEARSYADSNQLLFTEVSAKIGEGVNEMFEEVARRMKSTEEIGRDNFRNACKLRREIINLEDLIKKNPKSDFLPKWESRLKLCNENLTNSGLKYEVTKLTFAQLEANCNENNTIVKVDGNKGSKSNCC